MGIYLNPPADGFEDILKDGLYVDKTGLITYTNQVMGTSRKLTCFSRPRRFGKSYAAQMLVAFTPEGQRPEGCLRSCGLPIRRKRIRQKKKTGNWRIMRSI